MYKFYLNFILALASSLCLTFQVDAQVFSPESISGNITPQAPFEKPDFHKNISQNNQEISSSSDSSSALLMEDLTSSNKSSDPLEQITQSMQQNTQQSDETKSDNQKKDAASSSEKDIFIPEGELYRLNTPTLDGSKRGGQAFVEVDSKGRMKKVEKIFLFLDNFKITNFFTTATSCNARFNVLSNLDRKIKSLDIKLVWPDLTTTLSFSNISPHTQTYYNYALLGEGCYNMNKAPNIIVNRCRVKGLTSAECANKLIWLTK